MSDEKWRKWLVVWIVLIGLGTAGAAVLQRLSTVPEWVWWALIDGILAIVGIAFLITRILAARHEKQKKVIEAKSGNKK